MTYITTTMCINRDQIAVIYRAITGKLVIEMSSGSAYFVDTDKEDSLMELLDIKL